MDTRLFWLQRGSALILAPLVILHLIGMIIFIHGGLTTEDILGRLEGNWVLIFLYSIFIITVAVHAPIGIRNILIEWCRARSQLASAISIVLAILILWLGYKAIMTLGGLT